MFLISVLANRAQWSETGGARTTLMEVMTKSKQMVNLHTHHTHTPRTTQRVRLCFKHETTKYRYLKDTYHLNSLLLDLCLTYKERT
jgi:hypothetical protein